MQGQRAGLYRLPPLTDGVEQVGHQDARRAQHGEAAVHELRLLVPLELAGVLALRWVGLMGWLMG